MFDFAKGPVKFIRGGRYPFCHSVVVDDAVRAVIDASSERERLEAFKHQGPVEYLITSHAHEDHLVFNYLFASSKFAAHPEDAPHFAEVDSLIDCYGDMPRETWEKWKSFLEGDCHYLPRRADLFLQDGMILELGRTKVEILHTPGHTRGHLAFYFPGEKVLFTADLDLVKAGPYYGDRTSEIEETIQSLERLKKYDAEIYLTSHGKGVYEADPALIDRYLQVIFQREEKLVDFLMKGPKTLEEVVKEGIIYGQRTIATGPWDLAVSERFMMAKHLSRLVNQGRANVEGEYFALA